jgi:hypothetical protein
MEASVRSDFSPGDSGLTTASVEGSRSAVEVVSENAQASISLVPKLDEMPSWFAPIQGAIDTAQGQSKNWLKKICPAVSIGLPQAIVNYSSEFQRGSARILNTLEAIGSGTPTSAQKSAIEDALTQLLGAAQKQAGQAASVTSDLTAYVTRLVQDVNALGNAIGTLEAKLADGNQYVQQVKQAIGESFIDVESQLSPCEVIVTINVDIQVSVDTTGAPQPAIAVVIAQALVAAVDDNVKNAMEPLQIVLDSWGTLQSKIAAVIADLKSVQDGYVSFLQQFDLESAQTQWSQLSGYAAGLLPGAE